jgi:hypothetical protein
MGEMKDFTVSAKSRRIGVVGCFSNLEYGVGERRASSGNRAPVNDVGSQLSWKLTLIVFVVVFGLI